MTVLKTIGALVVLAFVLYVAVTLIGLLAATFATLVYMAVLVIVGAALYQYLKRKFRKRP